MKAYIDGRLLSANPYDASACPKTSSAWQDGWLDASRAWLRIHAREGSPAAGEAFTSRRAK
jgi:hypothetical protein